MLNQSLRSAPHWGATLPVFWAPNYNWRPQCFWGRESAGHSCPKPCLPINKDVEQPEEEFPRCSGVTLPLKSNFEPQTAIFDSPCIQGMAKQLFPSFRLNVKGASPISPLDISKIIKLISLVGFPKWHVSGCPGASGLGNLTSSSLPLFPKFLWLPLRPNERQFALALHHRAPICLLLPTFCEEEVVFPCFLYSLPTCLNFLAATRNFKFTVVSSCHSFVFFVESKGSMICCQVEVAWWNHITV